MQRSAHDIGNLGFVRRQLPERSADGPRHSARPETKTQTRKDPAATKPAIVESVLLRDPTAKAAIVESVLQDMRALNKPMEDLSSTNTRVDQISMKLSVLDNAVKSTEKAVTALREEHGSIAKGSGAQTSERVDALGRQLRTLEESFCSFSARLDRQCKDIAETVARLQSETSRKEDALAIKVRACEDLCGALQGKLQVQDVVDTVVQWLKREAIPDMKRTLAQADRSDILQAAAMAAHENLTTEMKLQIAAVACSSEAIHQYSLPIEAQVLRATQGKHAGETIFCAIPSKLSVRRTTCTASSAGTTDPSRLSSSRSKMQRARWWCSYPLLRIDAEPEHLRSTSASATPGGTSLAGTGTSGWLLACMESSPKTLQGELHSDALCATRSRRARPALKRPR